MKTIGLLGGMSWESTETYYRLINQKVRKELGGHHSAKILLYSVDFDEIEKLQHQGDWDATARILSDAALSLQKGGADFLVVCTNTMHKVVPQIKESIQIPILHIGDAIGQKAIELGVKNLGLLGTRFTMEQPFLTDYLSNEYGLDVIVPNVEQMQDIHEIIFDELCHGKVVESSKDRFKEIILDLNKRGATAVTLACTEIGMLIKDTDTEVPLLDTTQLHAEKAVDWALGCLS